MLQWWGLGLSRLRAKFTRLYSWELAPDELMIAQTAYEVYSILSAIVDCGVSMVTYLFTCFLLCGWCTTSGQESMFEPIVFCKRCIINKYNKNNVMLCRS